MKAKSTFTIVLALSMTFAIPAFCQVEGPLPQILTIGQSETINCTSNAPRIGIAIVNWVPGFQYLWSNGAVDSVLHVKPKSSAIYEITVTHAALGIHAVRSFEITVDNPPVITQDDHLVVDKYTCPGTELTLGVDVSGGYEPYSYAWSNGSHAAAPVDHPTTNKVVDVTVTDRCGSSSVSQVVIELEPHDPIVLPEATTFDFDCNGDEVKVYPKLSGISGGIGYGYVYSFSDWDHSNQAVYVEAEEEKEVIAKVTDGCQVQIAEAVIRLEKNPLNIPKLSPLTTCEGAPVKITEDGDHRLFYWDGNELHLDYSLAPKQTREVKLTYFDQCGGEHLLPRKVVISEAYSEFDYDVHAYTNTVDLFAEVGEYEDEYTWLVNGQPAGHDAATSVNLESGSVNEVTLQVKNKDGCLSSTSKTVTVRDNFAVANAISPNGDGRNDAFQLAFDEQFVQFDIKIFDRWGQLIYQSNDQYFAWQGNETVNSQLNTLVYHLHGVTISGQVVDLTGTLTIVN